MIECDEQAAAQIFCADFLFHPVGATIKATLAPARKIERGFAHRLGGDGAGVDRDAADTAAFFDDQDRFIQLRVLNGGTSASGTATDNNKIILVHEETPGQNSMAGLNVSSAEASLLGKALCHPDTELIPASPHQECNATNAHVNL
jgi:hypothetical protein